MTPRAVQVCRRSVAGHVYALLSVVITEWRIRWRMNSKVTLVAIFAALAVLLTPGLEAPYAVITVGGNRLSMNGDTMLVAAAVLLALLLLPVQFLTLTLGLRRDIQWGLAPLHLAAPLPPALLSLGRMAARLFGLCSDTLLILVLLSIAMLLQHHALPGRTALAIFLLILIPAGLAAFSIGMVIDALFRNVSIRIVVAFVAWCAVMLMTVLGGFDIIGYGLLSANLAGDGGPVPVSLGFSPASKLGIAEWRSLHVPTGWFSERWMLLLATGAAACATALLTGRNRVEQWAPDKASAAPISRDAVPDTPLQVQVGKPSALCILVSIIRRLLRRRGMLFGVIAAVAMLTALGAPRNLAPAAVLLLPIVLFSGRTPETAYAGFLVLPTLWRPTPNIMALVALASLMLLLLLPVALVSEPLQAGQMSLACLVAAGWFVYCNHVLRKPQLCQAIHILVWYLFAVNKPPPGFDLIGHSVGNPAVAATLALVGLVLFGMIATADGRRNRR